MKYSTPGARAAGTCAYQPPALERSKRASCHPVAPTMRQCNASCSANGASIAASMSSDEPGAALAGGTWITTACTGAASSARAVPAASDTNEAVRSACFIVASPVEVECEPATEAGVVDVARLVREAQGWIEPRHLAQADVAD